MNKHQINILHILYIHHNAYIGKLKKNNGLLYRKGAS